MITLNYLNEEWRPINGYENFYEISNYGRVKSLERYKRSNNNIQYILEGKLLKYYTNNSGYFCIVLYNEHSQKKHYLIHRLVARAFPDICGEWFDGCVIDHINGVKTDNMAVNLKVTNHLGNINNKITIGKIREARRKTGKKVVQYTKDGVFVKEYDYLRQIENETGFFHNNISNCCKGKTKTSYGYIWKFKEGA